MGNLRFTGGAWAGRLVEVDRELVLGREGVDLTIEDPELSRRHAAVRPAPGGIAVRDLGSLNGTFVNGQRITDEVTMNVNGTVRVGTTEIAVELPASAATVIAPRAEITTPPPGATVMRPTSPPPQPAAPLAGPPPQQPMTPPQKPMAPPPGQPVAPPTPPPRYGGQRGGPPGGGRPRGPLSGGPPGGGRPPAFVMLLRKRPLVPLLGLLVVAGIVVAIVVVAGGSSKSHKHKSAAVATKAPTSTNAVPGIVDKLISFTVINQNTTNIPCTPTTPDGKRYVLKASLVAPASVLSARPRAVVVMISGIIISADHLWRVRLGGSTDLDYALSMAKRGQAVVTVAMLGYEGSVTATGPNGNQVCAAAEADVIHQIVNELRGGTFQYGGASGGPSFDKVALMAFSIGGEYAKAAAYSFHNIDGLVTVGSSPPNFVTPLAAKLAASSAPDCMKQDRHKNADGSGPAGYTQASIPIAQRVLFYDGDRDPRDTQALAEGGESSPCGIFTSGQALLKADQTGLLSLKLSVLLTYGKHDGLVGTAGGPFQMKQLSGDHDKTLMIFPGVGHAWFLERHRAKWTNKVVGWLASRGL